MVTTQVKGLKRHLTQRRKDARNVKNKELTFYSKDFWLLLLVFLRLCVFALKFLTQDFKSVELVINSAE